ncbi:MAG: hypothetical protein Q8R82_11860 [Hyphomonadaceae bacterium]|nr:hypothetical protein [Hyphomonadaceae bacterium]
MQRLTLPTDATPPYVGGAGLLSTLIYPLQSEAEERAHAHGTLCAAALRLTTPDDAPFFLPAVLPFHAALADGGELFVDRLLNRIDVRDKAGAIATPAIWQSMHGKLDRLPQGMIRASMTEAFSKATSLDWFGGDDRNFRGRSWSPSLPVMHLICSFHFAIWNGHQEGHDVTLEQVLFNRNLQRAIVAGSNVFLPHVIKCWPRIQTKDLWLFQVQNTDLPVDENLGAAAR